MIYSVSKIIKHPTLNDYCKIIIIRQEPEINNNQKYNQEVSGSYESIKWFRNAIISKINQQNSK